MLVGAENESSQKSYSSDLGLIAFRVKPHLEKLSSFMDNQIGEFESEIQDIISLGGNAAGMSTVPEMMKARVLDMNIIGISCLTNYGAGMEGVKLSHIDVLEASGLASIKFSKLLFISKTKICT